MVEKILKNHQNLLVENGFSNDKIIIAKSNVVGDIGDYMALMCGHQETHLP